MLYMEIHGFRKTTLLDYPEHLSCVLFLGHCNFRCPFCHNSDLVLSPSTQPIISEEEVLSYLKKRQGILEGVCITGGEPSLQSDLPAFIAKIKKLNYKVKLDTNGYQPSVIKKLCEENLIDYIAMDIKNSKTHYAKTTGLPFIKMENIEESVSYLLENHVKYEFRTTVTKELHSRDDLIEIGKWLKGCSSYYLQAYKESPGVISPVFSSYSKEELLSLKTLICEYIPHTYIRGLD